MNANLQNKQFEEELSKKSYIMHSFEMEHLRSNFLKFLENLGNK